MAVTDERTKTVVSQNVKRLLAEQAHNVHWLQIETGEYPNRIYPVVRGEAMASAGLLFRIAEALGVTTDDLLRAPDTTKAATDKKPKPRHRKASKTVA